MPQDYNATVNLPKTQFPMRAGLPKREPDMLKEWYDMDLYHEMLKRTEGRPIFDLHDGPPFSNGHRAEQVPQGLHHPLQVHGRLAGHLLSRLGQPRHAH